MNDSILTISVGSLALAFVPVLAVVGLLWKWRLEYRHALYAVFRMLVQLLLIGYVLVYIFDAHSSPIILAVLSVMLVASSWIALRTVQSARRHLYLRALAAIAVGGGLVLVLITQGVLRLDPWYYPRYMVPLAGMIFANAMNAVSLAAERLDSEMTRGRPFAEARLDALRASLIPITNSLFAVGLVSLPGMMTGQILSGVSPFVAARYQIMVMCMIFGSAGLASACFLSLMGREVMGSAAPGSLPNVAPGAPS